MPTIMTSCWYQYTGPGRVGVCQGAPRGVAAGYRMYKALAPSWDLIKTAESIDDYRPRYFREVLDLLDPNRVLADVQKLAGGHTPVLMCFEKTPLTRTNFCHRTMVADWLGDKLGIQVGEWSGLKDLPLLNQVGA